MNRTNIANIQLNTNEIGEFLQKIQFSIFKDLKNTGIFLRIMIGLFITLGITQRMIVEYWGKDLFNVLRGVIAFAVPIIIEYAVVIMAFSNSISRQFIGNLVWVFWAVIFLAFFYNMIFIHFSCESIADTDVRLHIEGSFQFANLISFVCIEALGFLYMKVESSQTLPAPTEVVEQVKEKTVAEGSVRVGSVESESSETEVEQFPEIRIDHSYEYREISGEEFYQRYANLIPYFKEINQQLKGKKSWIELDRLLGEAGSRGKFVKGIYDRWLELQTVTKKSVTTNSEGEVESITETYFKNGVKPKLPFPIIVLLFGFLSACSVQSSVAEPPKTEKPKYRSFYVNDKPAILLEPVRKEVNPKEL